MRIIGNAAVREFKADYIAVSPKSAGSVEIAAIETDRFISGKTRTFSSFRSAKLAKKVPVKGLWEPHGS